MNVTLAQTASQPFSSRINMPSSKDSTGGKAVWLTREIDLFIQCVWASSSEGDLWKTMRLWLSLSTADQENPHEAFSS